MIWRHPALVLPALLTSGCIAPSPSASPNIATTTLKIASWNLEPLAERDGEGCRPRTEADYAALRGHSGSLGADVIAFQEVESVADARRGSIRRATIRRSRPVRRPPAGATAMALPASRSTTKQSALRSARRALDPKSGSFRTGSASEPALGR